MDREVCSRCGRQTDGEEPCGLCPSCLLQSAGFDEATDARERRCTSCDSMLPDDARFCASCGSAVPVAPQVPDDLLRHAIEAKLGAQYRVLRLLGRGGMGAVYLARDRFLDRLVAVKVLPQEAENADARERFLREARTAAKLTHPSIVPLHTFSQANDTLLYVMGFVVSIVSLHTRGPSSRVTEVRRIR